MTGRQVLSGLGVAGLVIHVVFLLLIAPLGDYVVDQEWEQVKDDPRYTHNGGDILWEENYTRVFVIGGVLCCIYPLSFSLVIIAYVLYGHKKQNLFGPVLGIGLGISSLVYSLYWLFCNQYFLG